LDGISPLALKSEQVRQRRLEAAKQMTFGECRDAYLETHDAGWKNDRHAAQWRMTLTKYCSAIADLPVKDIDTDLVVKVLTPLWKTRTETAMRLRGRIERVLAWAKGRGLRSGENPARWQGHLDEMLASPSKVKTVKHFAALPYAGLPGLMAELRERDAAAARALEFTILTVCRTGEVLGALWDEFDLRDKVWAIPKERMKSGRAHRVPLSDRAVKILQGIRHRDGRVFPLLNKSAMLETLGRLRPDLTVHGFRSTFRDWCAEVTRYEHHVVEAALAHAVADKVEAAYRRGDVFEKHRRLMDAWAAFCAKPMVKKATGSNVVEMRREVTR
jgi:integrase